jgi:phosphomannomutase
MIQTQLDLINNADLKNIQVLVDPHHGWGTTLSDDFLDYIVTKQFDSVLIPNMNDTNSKTQLQTRNLKYWSSKYNQNMYFWTDGTAWTSNQAPEWQP